MIDRDGARGAQRLFVGVTSGHLLSCPSQTAAQIAQLIKSRQHIDL